MYTSLGINKLNSPYYDVIVDLVQLDPNIDHHFYQHSNNWLSQFIAFKIASYNVINLTYLKVNL